MKVFAMNVDSGYVDKAEATVKSILWNNPNSVIHIINCDIPHEWFMNINRYINQFGASIVDDKLNPDKLSGLHNTFDHIKDIAFGRFFIPELINDDKVLYLDSDTIVDASLDDLFKYDLHDKMLAAVKDANITEENYNSGVMLINNKIWKIINASQLLADFGKGKEIFNGDQTIINEVFKGQIEELDPSYNYQIGFDKYVFWSKAEPVLKQLAQVKTPKIIHFLTDDKPFNMVSGSRLREKWWQYHNIDWPQLVNKHTTLNRAKLVPKSFEKEVMVFAKVAETEHLEYLINELPDVKFNIAAYTSMSWLLLHLTKYDNVRLYPFVIEPILDKLLNKSEIYLDINYLKEEGILPNFIENKKPVFTFNSVKTNGVDYSDYHIFNSKEDMVNAIKKTL